MIFLSHSSNNRKRAIQEQENRNYQVMPKHLFKKGQSGNPGGRPKGTVLTPERKEELRVTKEVKRYARQRAASFKEALDNILPLSVDRVHEVVKRKGKEHAAEHLRAFELISDRVFGRPPQAITGTGGGPLVIAFSQLLNGVDGSKQEKLVTAVTAERIG